MTTIVAGNVGVAFALVFAASAATCIGASVVFFPSLVKRASRRVLAASLGFAAGVMMYVSLVEIHYKSEEGYIKAGFDENHACIYSTLSFFGGILFMKIVDMIVKRLSEDRSPIHRDIGDRDIVVVWNSDETNVNAAEEQEEVIAPHCVGCCQDPIGELEEWHKKAELELLQYKARQQGDSHKEEVPPVISIGSRRPSCTNTNMTSRGDEESGEITHGSREIPQGTSDAGNGQQDPLVPSELRNEPSLDLQERGEAQDQSPVEEGNKPIVMVIDNECRPMPPPEDRLFGTPKRRENPKEEKKKLVKMGLSTALAIALHNFPEGLATFVAALDDPSVGAVFAIAIGLHNIPEGLCVALPIYYATGNRWKAFMWGCLSGTSELLAAFLGWLVLASTLNEIVYSTLFGLVAGMMVWISIRELIPTAHRYDPQDTVVTNSTIFGMAVMALSLVLLNDHS